MRKRIITLGIIYSVAGMVGLCETKIISNANDLDNTNVVEMIDEDMNIQTAEEVLIEKGYSMENRENIYLVKTIEKLKSEDKSDDEILEILDSACKENEGKVTRSNPFDTIDKALRMWGALNDDEKKLIIAYPNKALAGLAATNKAKEYTRREFNRSDLGDQSDAFRHTIWCALMSRDVGAKFAKDFSTAHESGKSEEFLQSVASDGHKEYEHREMDLHNNSIGVKLGADSKDSDEDLIKKVKKIMTNDKNTGVYWLHD